MHYFVKFKIQSDFLKIRNYSSAAEESDFEDSLIISSSEDIVDIDVLKGIIFEEAYLDNTVSSYVYIEITAFNKL